MSETRAIRPPRLSPLAVGAVLSGLFVVAFAARQATVLTTAGNDDGLFIGIAQSLASGRWLGRYNELTLVKGPGFPAFLALGNVLGLPYPLALGSFYAACAAFAGVVAARVSRFAWTGVALLAGLLLAPTLADGEMMRVFRDLFYGGLVVALASAAIALSMGAFRRWRILAVATGVLAAWAWLTREEGVWLLPLALVFVIPLLGRNGEAASGGGPALARLKPAAVAASVAVALVVGLGLVNWAVYGRFVVNELKDGAFQGALTALQDASAPYHKTGVPVPAAARARIYAVSPAFAELREPVLDGPMQAGATEPGCLENKAMCGDFGGGWFQWNLRFSAMQKGHHASADEAARFYRELAGQVRAACSDGRLTCERWRVPLIPPMTAEEIDDVVRSFGRVANVMTFGVGPNVFQRGSDLTGPNAERMLRLLNLPLPEKSGRIRIQGWYRADGASWFSVGGEGVSVLAFQRTDSPDVAAVFKDPRLARQRFALEVQCPPGAGCPIQVTPDGGAPVTWDLAKVIRGSNSVGGAEVFLDDPGQDKAAPFLKQRLAKAWIYVTGRLSPAYRALVVLGVGAYAAMLIPAIRRRELPAPVVIGTALLLAVLARCLILALIDALSFRATSNAYALPGMLLLVMFSVYSLGALLGRRRAPAG